MSVSLTESAAHKIKSLIEDEPDKPDMMFRIMVTGGGCSGFQYNFSLDDAQKEDDHIFTCHGVNVVVDEASLPFVKDAEIDYVTELIGSSFQIKNPNASASCGCGSSFSV